MTSKRGTGSEPPSGLNSSSKSSSESSPEELQREMKSLRGSLLSAQQTIKTLTEELHSLEGRVADGKCSERVALQLSRRIEDKNKEELEIARVFQTRVLPLRLPEREGLLLSAKYFPSERVGGDLYDVLEMPSNCLGVFIADVSGHGLPATLAATMAKRAVQAFSASRYSPAAILDKVNEELCSSTLGTQFLTAFFAVVDCDTWRMRYVNASHCPAILYDEDESFQLLDTEGLFLGMFQEPMYQEREVQLKAGTRLILYTDGITDAINPSGEPYKAVRLHDFIKSNRSLPVCEMIDRILEDLKAYRQVGPGEDDVTIVGLQVVAELLPETRIVIPSEPKELARVESKVMAGLRERNYSERALFAIKLALEEAIINAMKHGNHMDKARKVIISYSVDDKRAVISVEDEGGGFDPNAVPDPTLERYIEAPHGRGIMLMKAYMDSVTFSESGNKVTMVKRAPWA